MKTFETSGMLVFCILEVFDLKLLFVEYFVPN
jgi:hypothetical protein